MACHGFLALRIRDLNIILLLFLVVVREPLTSIPRQDILVVTATDEHVTIKCHARDRVLMPVHRHKVVVVSTLSVEHLDALRVAADAKIRILVVLLADEHHLHGQDLGALAVTVETREVFGVVNDVRKLREDGRRLIALRLLAGR